MRPPSEAQSLLIRAMRGCSWNKCAFCAAYKGIRFEGKRSLRSVAEVKGDIDTLKAVAEAANRISWLAGYGGEMNGEVLYLTAGHMAGEGTYIDPFYLHWLHRYGDSPETAFMADSNAIVLKAADLAEMIEYLYQAFPSLNRVTSYGRAKTVVMKKPGELERLREAGLTRLHLGLESGDGEVLRRMAKGATSDEMIEAGVRAKQAGFEVSEYVMPGLGGRELSEQHAKGTARVLNAVDPDYTRMRPLAVVPGTPLGETQGAGEFESLAPREVLQEIRTMIASLDITGRVCFDHFQNPRAGGRHVFSLDYEGYKFPEEQSHVLALIDRALENGG